QANQPWQQIEGVLVSAAKSGTQGGIYWDYTNVEEVKVGTFGSPSDIGTRGIALNGILKSGANTFSGPGFFAFQNDSLQSNNIDDELRAQGITRGDELDSRTDVSGDVGGRIVPDQLWVYGGVRAPTCRATSAAASCATSSGSTPVHGAGHSISIRWSAFSRTARCATASTA